MGLNNRCRVCAHPSRMAIDQAILNGKSFNQIARDFGWTYVRKSDGEAVANGAPVRAHANRCMAEAYQAAKAETLLAAGTAISQRIQHLDGVADEVIERNRVGTPRFTTVTQGDEEVTVPLLDPATGKALREWNDRVLLIAVREARQNAETLARLAGALPEGDRDNLDHVRAAQADPETRRLLAEIDEKLAAKPQSPVQ